MINSHPAPCSLPPRVANKLHPTLLRKIRADDEFLPPRAKPFSKTLAPNLGPPLLPHHPT